MDRIQHRCAAPAALALSALQVVVMTVRVLALHFGCLGSASKVVVIGGGSAGEVGGPQAAQLRQRRAGQVCACLARLVRDMEVFRRGGSSGITDQVNLEDDVTVYAIL